MTEIMTAVPNVMSIVNTVFESILENAVLVAVLAAGFVSIGIRIFRKLVRGSEALG